MITSLEQLKKWFVTGATPNQTEFYAWLDSFWHKDENISVDNISGLHEEINKATTNDKGIFGTDTSLKAKYPSGANKKGFYAFVGTQNPFRKWEAQADGGQWVDTGQDIDIADIDLAEYAKNTNANGDKVVYAPNGVIPIPEIDVVNEFGDDATKAIAQQIVSKRVEAIENTGFTSSSIIVPEDLTNIAENGTTGGQIFGNDDFYFEKGFNKFVFYRPETAGNVTIAFLTINGSVVTEVHREIVYAVNGRNEITPSDLSYNFSANQSEKKYIVLGGVVFANSGGNGGSWWYTGSGISRTSTNLRVKAFIYVPDESVPDTILAQTFKSLGTRIENIENLEPISYQDIIVPSDYSDMIASTNAGGQNWGTWDFYFKNAIKQLIVYRVGAGSSKLSFVKISDDKSTYTVVYQKTLNLVDGRNDIDVSEIDYKPTGEKIYITFSSVAYDTGASQNCFTVGDTSGGVTNSTIKLRLKAWVVDEEIIGTPSNLEKTISSHEQRLSIIENGAGGNGSGVIAHKDLIWTSLGDSITWLNDNPNGNVLYGYQTLLMTKYKIKTHINKAINGGGSGSLVGAMGTWTASDIFTIMIGINEYLQSKALGTIDDFKNSTANNTYYANMRLIIDRIYALNNQTIIFLLSPAFCANSVDANFVDAVNGSGFRLRDLDKAFREISEVANIPYVNTYSLINRYNVGQLTYDGVHINTLGMQRVASLIAPEFERWIDSIY